MKRSSTDYSYGERITTGNGSLVTPEQPIIPFIIGDGSGPDIWQATQRVINSAIEKAYSKKRSIAWMEVLAGQKAFDTLGTWLPDETLKAFEYYKVGIKGPLTTPVGEGIRSINVAMRKSLDLYACVRPIRYFQGVPSPLLHPENVDMVVFRENTEDVYCGVEFKEGTPEARTLISTLLREFPEAASRLPKSDHIGIGVKPISREGSERLVKASIHWTITNHRRAVTLVHKGNIMKYTEGAFRNWGYEIAEKEFAGRVFTLRQFDQLRGEQGNDAADLAKTNASRAGKIWVDDIITDAAFETAITRPGKFDVIATTNLNGDYLSDALAALVGGLGIAPGANINFETGNAIFEATHGTAPTLAGMDVANPCSLILSGELLLRHIGWTEPADLILNAIGAVLKAGLVTADLTPEDRTKALKTSQFGDALISVIGKG